MVTISIAQRTACTADDQLIGRFVTVVSGCLASDCHRVHSRGSFELLYRYPGNDWLTISPDNKLVRLSHNTQLDTHERGGATGHPLRGFPAMERPHVATAVQAMIEPYLVAKQTATPGCFFACTMCAKCRNPQVEPTLWLETSERVRNYPGGLAIVSGVVSTLLIRTMRAGDYMCLCPEG